MSKIVELSIHNVMRISAVHIEPTGNIVLIGGKNAAGKTTVLESIAMAMGGLKLCPREPIRQGEDTAEIELQLGDLTITRKFKRNGSEIDSTLLVRNSDGEPLRKPQAVLNDLIGSLAFDPLEFSDMSPRDRAHTLRELVGLDVEQLEEELQRVFDRRTEKGREKRAAQSVVDDMPGWPDAGLVETSVTQIGQRMADAVGVARDYEELVGVHADAVRDCEQIREQLSDLDRQIAELHARRETLLDKDSAATVRVAQAQVAVRDFQQPDIASIQAELDGVESANSKVRDNLRRAERAEDAETVASEWKELDVRHATITQDIKARTEAVTYPIDELELRKDGVYYQGVPFEQGSRAERIKVSIAIGCALNEKMRVLLIRDGSVLDDESMALIAQMAEEREFQFWIESARGYENVSDAIVIDDGARVS